LLSGLAEGCREPGLARLRHRQFGVFVTTSFISPQAYKEIVEDRHPVIVVSGVDIIDILYETNINTLEKVDTWLKGLAPAP